jgi:alcohol dehydrogenase class IV
MMSPRKKENGAGHESTLLSLTMPRETLFGAGCVGAVADAAGALGAHAFLLTGPRDTQPEELTERVRDELRARTVGTTVFRFEGPEPATRDVDAAADACAAAGCDLIVGLGGASVIDAAKLVALLCGHDAESIEPFLVGECAFERAGLPLVVVPTVAVIGTEIMGTAFAVDEEARFKRSVSHRHVMPTCVVIDPELTVSTPPRLTAAAGIGTFTLALEAFVSRRSNPLTETFALEAIRLVGEYLRLAVADGTNIDARTGLCLAGYLAGSAATGAGAGVVNLLAHALQHALGAEYGEAAALVLPASIEFNLYHARDKYAQVAELVATALGTDTRDLGDLLVHLYAEVGIDKALAVYTLDYRIVDETLTAIATCGGRAETNPRPVDRAGLVRILRHARHYI